MSWDIGGNRPIKTVTIPLHDIVKVVKREILADIDESRKAIEMIVKESLRREVPVRSGKLLDTLLNNLFVEVFGDKIYISSSAPPGYPAIIPNPAHLGEIGWGRKYKPINLIANRKVIRETPKGAYYLLNDPYAVGDYMSVIDKIAVPKIIEYVKETLPGFSAIVKTGGPSVPLTAKPSTPTTPIITTPTTLEDVGLYPIESTAMDEIIGTGTLLFDKRDLIMDEIRAELTKYKIERTLDGVFMEEERYKFGD